MRLGITAALSGGRRSSQLDLSAGGNSELRQVRVVGACGRLLLALALTPSLIETLTSTRNLLLGGRREPLVRVLACLGIGHAGAQTLLVTRTNARLLLLGHFLFHA